MGPTPRGNPERRPLAHASDADPNIQGKILTLNGERYDVVGVMPYSFYTAEAPVLWAPMAFKPKILIIAQRLLPAAAGRLKPA